MNSAAAFGAVCALLALPGHRAKSMEWFVGYCECACRGTGVRECFPGLRRCVCNPNTEVPAPTEDEPNDDE